MFREAPTKVKFKRLQRALNLRLWQAVGLLESLWLCTYANAADGGIGKVLSDDDIAAWLEWEGDAAALIDAMVETRWLDRDKEYRLIVHDWHDHCSNQLKGAFAQHGKVFADVAAKERGKQVTTDDAKQPAKQDAKHLHQTNRTKVPTDQPIEPTIPAMAIGALPRCFLWNEHVDAIAFVARRMAATTGSQLIFAARAYAVAMTRGGRAWLDDALASADLKKPTNPGGYIRKVLCRTARVSGFELAAELEAVGRVPDDVLTTLKTGGTTVVKDTIKRA